MKKLILGATLVGALATASLADQARLNITTDQMRDDLIVSSQSSPSGAGIIIPIMLLAILGAALSAGGGGGSHGKGLMYLVKKPY